MKEDDFVTEAMAVASTVLKPPFAIQRGAALLYEVTVNNRLEVTIDPKHPVRGQSAFQTDLCVFESIPADSTEIPRVVLEFKANISTHDVLTYSTKARKHKQVYPYLRYGIVIGNEVTIPGRVFRHNDGLDFCFAAARHKKNLKEVFASLLEAEVAASRRLESIAFRQESVFLFRKEVLTE